MRRHRSKPFFGVLLLKSIVDFTKLALEVCKYLFHLFVSLDERQVLRLNDTCHLHLCYSIDLQEFSVHVSELGHFSRILLNVCEVELVDSLQYIWDQACFLD